MAQLTITVPDAVFARAVNGFAGQHGYDPASGKSKVAFAQQVLASFFKQSAVAYEATRDAELARRAARTKAEDEINVT